MLVQSIKHQITPTIHITPSSLPLIYNLLNFLSQCKNFVQDSSNRLLDLLVKLLRLYLSHLSSKAKASRHLLSFTRGFPDSETAERSFLLKFLNGVEGVMRNIYLPIRYHTMLSEMMGSENEGVADIVGKIVDGTI